MWSIVFGKQVDAEIIESFQRGGAAVCNLSGCYDSGIYCDLLSGFPDYIQSVL